MAEVTMATSDQARRVRRTRRWSPRAKREFTAGLIFALPWIIGFLAFLVYPMVASMYYSFTRYDLPLTPRWTGLANYIQLLTDDRLFWKSLANSMYLSLVVIPASVVFSLLCAILLNLEIRGQAVWRTIYILPNLMPAVAGAILWSWIMNPQLGLVNNFLKIFGITRGPLWFNSPTWSKPSLIIMQLWGVGGMTIIYLAALQNVPKALYEAAQLDGAGPWKRFTNVTLPMISGVTLFQLITNVIWALGFFTTAYILGGSMGAPQESLLFYGLYLYTLAFEYLRMGYASAMAWVLFVITLVITLITLRTSREYTFYEVI